MTSNDFQLDVVCRAHGSNIVDKSTYGSVMMQNPPFIAPNSHMTSHQFNKSAKNENDLTHTKSKWEIPKWKKTHKD